MSLESSLSLHEWACLHTELIWVYDHPPLDWDVEYDYSRASWAWLVRRGEMKITQGSRTTIARSGMWLIPPSSKIRLQLSRDCHIVSLHFFCQWPSGQNLLHQPEPLTIDAAKHPDMERKAVRLEQLVRRHFPHRDLEFKLYSGKQVGYPLFLQLQTHFFNWLTVWFETLVENGAFLTRLHSGDDRLFQALRRLNEAPLDQGFPAERLQQATDLSEVHLTRLFLNEFGLTPHKYWEKRRLEFAQKCLETTRMPVKEIAFRLGFRSDANFAVWFHRLARLRPGLYRRNRSVWKDIRLGQ